MRKNKEAKSANSLPGPIPCQRSCWANRRPSRSSSAEETRCACARPILLILSYCESWLGGRRSLRTPAHARGQIERQVSVTFLTAPPAPASSAVTANRACARKPHHPPWVTRWPDPTPPARLLGVDGAGSLFPVQTHCRP